MSYSPNIKVAESAIGVNSDTAIAGGNWTGNNYLGQAELNDFSYFGFNLQTDEAGTLTYEFSQDGTNWSIYPFVQFTIASGVNEVHGAWKGGRYLRAKFTGTGGRTYFRLKTFFSYEPVVLTAPLNQSISGDSDATIVKAINVGENPAGTYENGSISGVDPSNSTTTPLGAGATFTGDWVNVSGYHGVSLSLGGTVAGATGTLWLEFSHDGITAIDGIGTSSVISDLTTPPPHTVGVVSNFFRARYVNDATAQTSFSLQTILQTERIDLTATLTQTLTDGEDVRNVRAVITGQNTDGDYVNIGTSVDGALLTSSDSSLIDFKYDAYAKVSVDTITDRFDYYVGGLAGTITAFITIVYEDSSKQNAISAARTKN